MMIVLTALGAILLLAGVILSFRRHDPNNTSETKVSYKGIEITATKPSIVLILVGALLVVLPHIPGVADSPKPPTIPGPNIPGPNIPGPNIPGPNIPGLGSGVLPMPPGINPTNWGSRCCFPGGACPMFAPDVLGGPCLCWDTFGNMASGTVCQ